VDIPIEYGTIAATEVAWTAILGWAAFRRYRRRAYLNTRIDDARALEDPPADPTAIALLENDRDTETDWALFKAMLATAGPAQMIRENAPWSPGNAVTVTILFIAVLFLRYRSERRDRRRDSIELRTERKHPDEWDGTERRVHRGQRPYRDGRRHTD
jgi:hypothetical protein